MWSFFLFIKKSMKIPMGKSEAVNQRTDNKMIKRKSTNNDLQNTTQKTKIEQHNPYRKPGVNSCAPEV